MHSRSTRKDSRESQEFQIVEEKVKNQETTRKYSKGRFLGKGGFARVYEMVNLETNKSYAGKVIPKANLVKARARQKLLSEIKIHRSLSHTNVVNFDHFFEDAENIYILLELCPNQTLNELMRRRKRLTQVEAQCYLLQVISALKYLHSHRVIHRDIKLGNLFLSEKMEIKLGDFGLATKLEFEGERKRTICGTPNYIAPEILEGRKGHSYEVDVWSLGVLAYTLIVGRPPFETQDVKSTYKRIKTNSYGFPEHIEISEEAKSLISRILIGNPSNRPSLDEILQMPFFAQHEIPQLLPASTLAVPPSSSYVKQFTTSVKTLDPKKSTKKVAAHSGFYDEVDFLYVKKWVDYSNKYGLGYLLSNGSVGVYFNDSTKIISSSCGSFFKYVGKEDKENEPEKYDFFDFPKKLEKKVTLLQHFRKHLYEQNLRSSNSNVYLKKWVVTDHAVFFRLSNKLVQVQFLDKTELILCNEKRKVTYLNKKAEKLVYPLSKAMESGNQEMTKRLRYTKEVLTSMLHPVTEELRAPLTDRRAY